MRLDDSAGLLYKLAEEVHSNRCGGKQVPAGEEERGFLLLLPLCRQPAEDVARIKGVCHHAWN